MSRLRTFASDWEAAPRPAPPGTTLLAVGDVHGCSAQLEALLDHLGRLIDGARRQGQACEVVMLGDYADRGPDSLGVLRLLPGLGERLGVPVHLLRGNHDQMLIELLRPVPHPGQLDLWRMNGGTTVLAELGIAADEVHRANPARIGEVLREALGPELVGLLRGLATLHRCGAYLFVHGGVHPDHPLETQSLGELIWMREPFLGARSWRHPFVVVHGHTPIGLEVLPHRVGVDSGCFFTGVLSAVELSDDRLRFHCAAPGRDPGELLGLLGPGQARRFVAWEGQG